MYHVCCPNILNSKFCFGSRSDLLRTTINQILLVLRRFSCFPSYRKFDRNQILLRVSAVQLVLRVSPCLSASVVGFGCGFATLRLRGGFCSLLPAKSNNRR